MTIPRDLSNLAPGANTSGVLQPSKGGTGLTSPGTNGNVLTSNGSAWVSSTPASSGSGGTTSTGNVTLTSASTGAQSITTTAFGQFVALPDATTMSKGALLFNIENAGPYPLRVKNSAGSTLGFIYPQEAVMVGLSDNSTAAGVWNIPNIDPIAQTASYISTTLYSLTRIREVRIDADRLLFTYGGGPTNLYAQVYNETTQTWGSPTLVRSSSGNNIAVVTGANQVLVCSSNAGSAFQAVVLTLSGTSITVGTAASATGAGTFANFFTILSIGSSWVVTYGAGAATSRAMTISGTTVTVGSESFATPSSNTYIQAVALSSTRFFVVSIQQTVNLYVEVFDVSGTTITAGGTTSVNVGASEIGFRFTPISSGTRWAIAYVNSGTGNVSVGIISVSGSTPSISSADTGINLPGLTVTGLPFDMIVSGSKLIAVGYSQANIVTDTSGTASAGTLLNVPAFSAGVSAVTTSSNVAIFWSISAASPTNTTRIGINFSGSSPAIDLNGENFVCTANLPYGFFPVNNFNGNFTDTKRGAWFYGTVNYNFYGIGEVMAVQSQHAYKAVTRARPALSNPAATLVVGVSGNELVYYNSSLGNASNHGAVTRFESIT